MALFSLKENFSALWNNERQNNIDLLRAIAVISVFIHHAQHAYGGNFPFLGDYGGQFGPQLFFLISGYLISASCQKHSLRDYAIHRIFRIMPAYLAFFIIIGIITNTVNLRSIFEFPWRFFANLILLQQLFPSALLTFDVLHVTWTLTVEVIWYVLAPLLFWKQPKLRFSIVFLSIFISTAWSLLASLGFLDGLYPEIIKSNPGYSYLFIGNNFISQFCFFVFGAWLQSQKNALSQWNPLAAFILFLLVFILKSYYMIFNPIFITGIGLTFLMLGAINSPPIKNRFIFLISETSYSIYLCHFPIILWVRHGMGLESAQGVLVSILLTMTISVISYVCIEKPGMRLGRRIAENRHRSLA